MGYFLNKSDAANDQNLKEAYFTASQGQLIRARYKSNRTAMFAGWVLTLMILLGFFSEFLSPYEPTIAGRDKKYENGSTVALIACPNQLALGSSEIRLFQVLIVSRIRLI
jgi:hypothetical protein